MMCVCRINNKYYVTLHYPSKIRRSMCHGFVRRCQSAWHCCIGAKTA